MPEQPLDIWEQRACELCGKLQRYVICDDCQFEEDHDAYTESYFAKDYYD